MIKANNNTSSMSPPPSLLFATRYNDTNRNPALYNNEYDENNEITAVQDPNGLCGSRINQYEVLKMIGKGAQGIVYCVKDIHTSRTYAMKTLAQSSVDLEDGESDNHDPTRSRSSSKSSMASADPALLQRMRHEVAIMKLLSHPNLVGLHDVIDDPSSDELYLVMELVDGGPIMDDDVILQGTAEALPEEQVRGIFSQLITGLAYLHYNSVLHRDIKPGNVLISKHKPGEEPVVKLCDFGVSSLCSKQKPTKILGEDDMVFAGSCGTPALLPPEALGAGPDNLFHGRPADVWACGITLFCLLYGRLPFAAKGMDDITSLQAEIVSEETIRLPASPAVSAPCRSLLLQMLKKDPDNRITLSGVADHEWLCDLIGQRDPQVDTAPNRSRAWTWLSGTNSFYPRVEPSSSDIGGSLSAVTMITRTPTKVLHRVSGLGIAALSSGRKFGDRIRIKRKGKKNSAIVFDHSESREDGAAVVDHDEAGGDVSIRSSRSSSFSSSSTSSATPAAVDGPVRTRTNSLLEKLKNRYSATR